MFGMCLFCLNLLKLNEYSASATGYTTISFHILKSILLIDNLCPILQSQTTNILSLDVCVRPFFFLYVYSIISVILCANKHIRVYQNCYTLI